MNRSTMPRLLTLFLSTVVLALPVAHSQPDKGASVTGGGEMMSMMRENNDKMMR